MTDEQVLALLMAEWGGTEAVRCLVWAKTEGMADVDRAVREWHDAKRAKGRPRCLVCGGRGTLPTGASATSVPCNSCDGSGYEGGPTYEENHIGVPDGLPRTQ